MPTQPAILGTMRVGNFRVGYESTALAAVRSTRVRIQLAGADVRVRVSGLTVRDLLNEAPNTCDLTIGSPAPASGQALRVTINSDTPRLLFNGTIQTDDLTYEGKSTHLVYPCSAIDDTARLNKRRPFGTWTDISATTIAQSIVTTYASGFTSAGVASSLPTVTITFDGQTSFMGCLMQLATLIGGYCNVVDGVVYLFLTDATDLPDPIQSGYPFLDDPPIRVTSDDSQLRTRVYGKGHAEALLSDVLAAETLLPVADTAMYNVAGGQVIVSTTPDGAASEILTYVGRDPGGGGTLTGPGARPSTAPTAALAAGTGLGAGTFLHSYTWVTAAGESLPAPRSTVTTGVLAAPVSAPIWTSSAMAGSLSEGYYTYVFTYTTAAGETTASPKMIVEHNIAGQNNFVTGIVVGPSGTTSRKLYRTVACASQAAALAAALKLTATIANNVDTTVTDTTADGSLGATVPGANTASAEQVSVSAIAAGPTGTTSRKVYRTAAGGAQLKLVTTLADNTTTTYLDATADGSLGANAPITDTSGLTQPVGQENPGSSSLRVASTGGFSATGGWALVGLQVIRYQVAGTFADGTFLTLIPTSGAGSITAPIPYNSTVVAAPTLTGVTGLTKDLMKSAAVHIWVQRDDLVAQADAAIRESTATYTSTGIHELLITDERRGEASLSALCDADLIRFANPIVTVTYATRDVKTKSGKLIVVNLANPPISETLTIQEVTITEIDQSPGTAPRYTVTASSVRFSLEDTLRRMATRLFTWTIGH